MFDTSIIYNDPIIGRKRKGLTSDPYKQITETLTVNRNYVVLTEVPNRLNKVQISGKYEVENQELTNTNLFTVDYTHGVVFFHTSLNGSKITFSYMGEGALFFPDSRIYISSGDFKGNARDKFVDIDREILEQRNRVDTLILENPQPSEVVDMRVDRNGRVFPVARDRINSEQKKIEDAYEDLNNKQYTSLKDRLNKEQQVLENAYLSSDNESLFDNLNSRLKYDYTKLDTRITTETNELNSKIDSEVADLTNKLNNEVNTLNNKIERNVNVLDFGAKGDGVTDCTEAFKKAIGDGKVRVTVPEGVYLVKGIKLPSYTKLIGKGKDITTLKLHESTPAEERLIINFNHITGGNKYIYVEDMTLDGNQQRQGGLDLQGGNRSSTLTLAGVSFAWVNNVKSVNSILHGFDITALGDDYPYDGDGIVARGRSQYIWFDKLEAYNWGDDGITTHHSDYLFISNSHCEKPRRNGNVNGIEIDDGSRHVFLMNNSTKSCFGGVEVKGHGSVSAAQNIHILGHISVNDNRSYNFRHIGHHSALDPESKTAYDIVAQNLVSLYPSFNGVYGNSTPRALVISAYKNVSIDGFTAIGDPSHNYLNNPVIALQYKSRNISLNNINVREFRTASVDIRLFGGAQHTDNVNISNVNIYNSAKQGIGIGGSIQNVNINNVTMTNTNGDFGVTSVNSQANINNINVSGYTYASKIAGNLFKKFVPNNIKNGTRIATTSGQALDNTSAVIAATVDPIASGSKTVAMASSSPKAGGEASAVIATTGGSSTRGVRNAVIASSGGSFTEGSRTFLASSNNSRVVGQTGVARTVLSSGNLLSKKDYTVTGGYGSGAPSSANRKWLLDSKDGNVVSVGVFTGGHTFKDYGEYFESQSGDKISTGTLVTLVGDKIKPANKGDYLLGSISETAGIVLGQSTFHWQGRYLRNEFGGLIYETSVDDKGVKRTLPKENPDYFDNEDYLSREDRPEWNIVGLVGQVYIKIDESVSVGDTVQADNGIASKVLESKQDWRIMKITTPYSKEKGYGVALCFIR